MSGYIATAAFRICGQQSEVKKLALYDGYSATQTEINLLDEFGEDGRANYPLFHVDDEACSIQRPISDLILIWHHDKIEASGLCLHLYNRKHFLEVHEIKAAQNAWEGETASNIFVREDESDITKTEESCKLKIRLNFWFLDQPPGEAKVWNPRILNLDPQTRVDTMSRLVMRELVSVLQKDPSMISLQNGQSKLHFGVSIKLGDWRDQYVDFSWGKVYVESFGDLLLTPCLHEEILDFDVTLQLDRDETAPLADFDASIVEVTEPRAQFFYLGSLKDQPERVESGEDDLALDKTMFAHLCHRTQSEANLSWTPTLLYNGQWIGDYLYGTPFVFTRTHKWREQYQHVTSVRHLDGVLKRRSGSPADREDDETDLPVIPTYSFNHFQSDKFGLGLKYQSSGGTCPPIITVFNVVKILDSEVKLAESHYSTHQAFHSDTPESLLALLEDQMKTFLHNGSQSTWDILQECMPCGWTTGLWVMPQIENYTKLHRWLEGTILQFLHPEKAHDDGRLYVELHILSNVSASGGQD